MKKVMLLGAVVAMMLAAAVPALAQTVTQVGDDNIACVQTAVQQNVVSQGDGNAQANEEGDNVIVNSNINAQAISQECNIAVEQVNTVVNKALTVNKGGKVVKATASASAAAPVQYKATASASAAAPVQYKATASASAAAPVQYQYASAAAAVQYQYASAPAVELPSTGGSSLIALGAGVLLVAGGLLARRIVR